MALRRGFIDHLDYGSGASTTATVGRVLSGTWEIDDGGDYDYSIGGYSASRDGMVSAKGNATFLVTNSCKTVLGLALRASITANSLTDCVFQAGTSSEAYQMLSSHIDSLKLTGRVNQSVQAEISWVSRAPSVVAVPTWKSYDTGAPFQWFQGTCTIGGSAYTMQDFSIDLNNNVTAHTSLDVKSANSQRLPEELVDGNEIISATFTVAVPITSTIMDDPFADNITFTNDISLAFVNASSETFTITMADLKLKSWSKPFAAGGDVVYWTLTMEPLPNTASGLTLA